METDVPVRPDALLRMRASACAALLGAAAIWSCVAQEPSRAPAAELPVYRDWQLLTRADGLPDDSVRALCRFRDQLWVGTDDGLALNEGGRWRSWKSNDGLPHPAIHAIDVDPSTHDVWLGTWGGGLVRFSAGRFERFDQFTSGLAGNLVFAVRAVGPRVWVATNAGLSVFEPQSGTWDLHLERKADGPDSAVSAIASARGRVFASAWHEGVWSVAERAGEGDLRLTLGDGSGAEDPVADAIAALAAVGDQLWVCSATKLWRNAGTDAWSSRLVPAPLAGLPRCFAVSADGAAWLGADSALTTRPEWDVDAWLRYEFEPERDGAAVLVRAFRDGRELDAHSLPALPATGRVRCIAAAEDELWVGASRGLLRGRARSAWDGPGASAPSAAPLADARAPVEPRTRIIGILGPFGRTVALPGERAADDVAHRIDDFAAEIAADAVAEHLPARGEPAIEAHTITQQQWPYAWSTPEDGLIDVVREHDPLALVGFIEPGKRVWCAVSLAAEIPWMNAALSAPAVEELASPWIFRCPSNDAGEQARLLERAFELLHCRRPVLLRAGEPFADLHLEWWKQRAAARGTPVVAELPFPPADAGFDPWLAQLRAQTCDVLLTWSEAAPTADLVRRLREHGLEQPVLGSDELVTSAFLERAGAAPGVVLAPQPCEHRLDQSGRALMHDRRWPVRMDDAQQGPSTRAWASYDAARHVMEAIEKGGVERESLRRALRGMSRARLARVVDGRWQALPDASAP